MFRFADRLLFAMLMTAMASAQSPAGARKFEVASIKRNPDHGVVMPNGKRLIVARRAYPVTAPASLRGISGNRFTEQAATVSDLIMDAYRLRQFQIAGAPRWASFDGDAYDIQAKSEDERPAPDQIRLMLQTLLATRFRLQFHIEKRETPVYHLVIARNGLKMKKAPPGPDGKLPQGAVSMELIATMVADFLDRPLVDQTGLDGYFLAKWDQSELIDQRKQTGGAQAVPSVFRAVQDQLGLELKAAKSPFDTYVIDRVERPSEN